MTDNITHEDLAGIRQHDWFFTCYLINNVVPLADCLYCVVCVESGKSEQISFTNLTKLAHWAGY